MGELFIRSEIDDELIERGFKPGTVAFQQALRLVYIPTDDEGHYVERDVPVVLSASEYEAIKAVATDQAFITLYDRLRTTGQCSTHETALAEAKQQWHAVNAD
jgi:hypothetical protein